eukprot:g20048.t1
MKYKMLGRTDISVSEICLGTMTWGSQNTEAEAHAQMDYAVAQGINFFDTAELYPTTPVSAETYGRTEEFIGSWLKKRGSRDNIVLATKIAGAGREHIRQGRPITSETIREAVDASLRRLQTDYIDLYQIHWPNRGHYHFRNAWNFDATTQDGPAALASVSEKLETLGALVKEGKIRTIGLSNETAWGTMQYLRVAQESGLPRVVSIQNEYNLLYRTFDLDLAEVSHHESVGLLAYSPLAAGLLTGKYLEGARPEGSRGTINTDLGGRLQPLQEPAVRTYLEVATKHGLDLAQMALAFCLARPFMASVIIGATTMEQLKTNIGAADLTLSDEVGRIENWGLKSLTYRIKKNRKAHYALMDIDAPAAAVHEMERQMRINEDVLRYMTIAVEKHEEGPSAMMQKRDRDDRPRDDRGPRRDFGDRPPRRDGEFQRAPRPSAPREA